MRGLIFDPFAGLSGDMVLGALVDLGLEPGWLVSFVASLGLGNAGVVVERVTRRGIACGRVRFELPRESSHRHLRHVLEIIDRSGASQVARERAAEAFRRLAAAEAEVHGTGIEQVHFHEVGALDAILDVLCVMAGIAELGVECCYTRPVAVGSGWIEIEHGRFPVPAPATLKLLDGLPVNDAGLTGECTTPTGAAILATLTNGRRAPAEALVRRSGFGAGTRDPEDRPNCLRLILCELPEPGLAAAERMHLVQTDIDDLAPEYLPGAQAALLDAGAADVVAFGISMKKGRPGVRLEALVPEGRLDEVLTALFRATTTIGARHWPVARPALTRQERETEWRGQTIRWKHVILPDGGERAKPEYEDVARAAAALGLPVHEVRRLLEVESAATNPARDV